MWMLRFLLITLTIFGFPSLSSSALATTKLVGQSGCFAGPFSNHESWIEFIRNQNQHMEPDKLKAFLDNIQQAFPEDRFNAFKDSLECQFFRYTVDEESVDGFIVHPKDAVATETIVYNRGGNATYGAMNFFSLFNHIFDIADQGFTVIGSQYRGASVQGPESKDEFGGADVQDVLALRELFSEFPSIDSKRVGLMGWSRGSAQAMLALKQGFETPAVALMAGNYDYKKGLKFRPEMEQVYKVRIPDYDTHKDQALEDRSALMWAETLPKQTSFLLIHGTADDRVRYESSVELHEKLLHHGFEAELMTLTDDGHNLRKEWPAIVDKLAEFFKRELNAE